MAKIIGNTTATPTPVSDWSQNDNTKADYIKNKPTIPAALSELKNDAGYVNTVDDELNMNSENPVQNKVVAAAISDLSDIVGDTPVSEQIQKVVEDEMAHRVVIQFYIWGEND